jgi:hypothetical protein
MDALQTFTPVALADLAAVALLDRTDTKYVLTHAQLTMVLPALRPFYRVLEIDGWRQSGYRTLYFDTPDFALYRHHQDGRRVRYKVRSRQYVGTPLAFVEVKHKTGPNHTRKERLATPELVTELSGQVSTFLHDRIPLPAAALAPVLWVDYTRITLVGRTTPERLTIDLDLRYAIDGHALTLPGLVIAELKSQGRPRSSPFVELMRQHLIRPSGFSKYCVGAGLLYPTLKHNRFSRILRRIDQFQERSH